jgi:hypothetical protein
MPGACARRQPMAACHICRCLQGFQAVASTFWCVHPFGDSGFSYVLSKRPRRLKFGNSERDGEDQASGRTADRDVLHVRAKGCRQGIGTAVKRLQARLRRGSTGRSCPAITSRHRPKPAGNASTCGTGVPITISMAHSTKRTAIDSHHCGEQKVALMGWSEVGSAMLKGGRGCSSNHSYSSSEEQVAIGEAQTSTPGEPRKAKQACRDQPKGWRRRRLSEQLQPRSLPSLRKSHLDARRFAVNTKTKIAVRLVTHEICAHYCVASRHLSKNGARMENARLLGATLVSPVRIGRDGKVCVGQSRLS